MRLALLLAAVASTAAAQQPPGITGPALPPGKSALRWYSPGALNAFPRSRPYVARYVANTVVVPSFPIRWASYASRSLSSPMPGDP